MYGIFLPAEAVEAGDDGVESAGADVAAGDFCVGVTVAAGAEGRDGCVSPGTQGFDVGVVVFVGAVVVVVDVVFDVVVDVVGSHASSAREGELVSPESLGWAMTTATGVVIRNSAVAEIASARVMFRRRSILLASVNAQYSSRISTSTDGDRMFRQ
ncbi:hypothetical protein BKP30_27015 [Rhodococcus erythropolis]|nr:hypothetical protein BKP30_27015 [Rhodococcus erythropolis]